MGNFIISIMVTLMIWGGAFLASGVWGTVANTYDGDITFNSIDEAYSYQKQVIDTATKLGAKVQQSDITIESPPRYQFSVKMPNQNSFPYGKLYMSYSRVFANTVATWSIGFIAGIIFMIISTRYLKRKSTEET